MNNTKSRTLVIIFLIGVLVFIIGKLLSGGLYFDSLNDFLFDFTIYQSYAFVLGYSNAFFFQYLETRDWSKHSGVQRIVVGILGSTLISLAGLFLLRMLTAMGLEGKSYAQFLQTESGSNYVFGLAISLIVVLVFHLVYFYSRIQKKKVQESQIIAKTETAKFESLKNQLDPHFLFNSLNVLTSLIGENPYQAEKFTTKLSKVYRYVLEQKDKDLISLDQELKFAKSYMQLLQMRFEEAINFSIPDQASHPEMKIVPLSLQLLLENAVKHNVITSAQPLNIKIYEQGGMLVVENNKSPKSSLEKSTKVGLLNIKQRYRLVTERPVEVQDQQKTFQVRLPLLNREVKIIKTDYMNENAKYLRAKKRVEELKEFYGSLISYCFVIPFLYYINQRTSPHFQWFWFPMFGWGLGLLIQAFKTFGYGNNWEDRKIRELMDKDRQNNA